MRAAVVNELSGPDCAVISEIAEPTGAHPRADGRRLLVEVRAAGLSFIDALQTRGGYQNGVAVPFVSGSEFSGTVLETPPSSDFRPGDRVAGIVWHGAVSERVLAHPDYTVKLPDSMSFEAGAALYMNYSTAWYALHRAGVRSGETVLVHGAAGGVGTATLDLCAVAGTRTIAVVSDDTKEGVARECGADEVVRFGDTWLDEVRAHTGGRGVDTIIDPVGGDRFTDSLRALRQGGRLVVVGFAGGEIPTVKVNRLLHRNLTITGITMDNMEIDHPGTLRMVREAVESLAAGGRLRPYIGARFTMAEISDALRSIEDRTAFGKVIVDIGTDPHR